MKKLIILGCALLAACSSYESPKLELTTDEEKAAYAVGFNTADALRSGINNQGLKDYLDFFLAGVKHSIESNSNKSLLSSHEMEKHMELHRERVVALQEERRNTEAVENYEEGRIFQFENSKRDRVTTLASGLQYEVIKEGDGNRSPSIDDTVVVHYHGAFLNGIIFDSSTEKGTPLTFPIARVIEGWQEAIQLMSEGDKWRIVVPPHLAYGETGSGNAIGPNSTLIFEIELIEIKS